MSDWKLFTPDEWREIGEQACSSEDPPVGFRDVMRLVTTCDALEAKLKQTRAECAARMKRIHDVFQDDPYYDPESIELTIWQITLEPFS